MALSQGQAVTILQELGWRVRSGSEYTSSIKNFQAGWNLAAPLVVDGLKGPKTDAALSASYAAHKAGRPTASAHFSFTEFRCNCGGRFMTCARIWVRRELLVSLEKYRARVNRPVAIVSGCRCSGHNAYVGGAKSSQHMLGRAVDVGYALSDTQVKALHSFSGIGRSGRTRMVRHVDVRTAATYSTPIVWDYTS